MSYASELAPLELDAPAYLMPLKVKPLAMKARVSHGRRIGTTTNFAYTVLMLRLPLGSLLGSCGSLIAAVNRAAWTSVQASDHGYRDKETLPHWIQDALDQAQNRGEIEQITLLTLPRVFGLAFKPVSFWFCTSNDGSLRTVLCEVNNTFGETHTYVCEKPDGSAIEAQDQIEARKLFHVSPFFTRDGHYRFRFRFQPQHIGVRINHFAEDGSLRLETAVSAKPVSSMGATVTAGMTTLLVFPLILRRAFTLWRRKIPFVKKPLQAEARFSK